VGSQLRLELAEWPDALELEPQREVEQVVAPVDQNVAGAARLAWTVALDAHVPDPLLPLRLIQAARDEQARLEGGCPVARRT
jgi:hypothetical protein